MARDIGIESRNKPTQRWGWLGCGWGVVVGEMETTVLEQQLKNSQLENKIK